MHHDFLRVRPRLIACGAVAAVAALWLLPARLSAAETAAGSGEEVELSLGDASPPTASPSPGPTTDPADPPLPPEPPAAAASPQASPAATAPVAKERAATDSNTTPTGSQEPDGEPAAAKLPVPTPPVPTPPVPTPPVAKPPVAKPTVAKRPVLVPGTGTLVKGGSDDFEDEQWKWFYNHPKSSEEQDKRVRSPVGKSANGRWFEGPKRGTPDVVKRIPLPAAGLEGSGHGMLIQTLAAGIPGRVTYQMQQDDLVFNMQRATGRGIYVADSPSVVVRVYMPPFEQWENRSGPSFGFRAGCFTHAIITGDDHPDEGRFGLEEYWPGMFVCFESSTEKRYKEDGAYIRVRGGRNGGEILGPRITELGWWTLGLSFSPDGMVHYFASPGVDDLTMEDHITSQYPYGYRTEWLKTYFFNVCTRDDGRTWSTPWVIDDPKAYFVKRPQMATTPTKKR